MQRDDIKCVIKMRQSDVLTLSKDLLRHQEGHTKGYAVCYDIVLSRQNHWELEDHLKIWRNALERRGLKVSRSKTEYLKAGIVDDGEELKLQGEKLKRVKN